MSGTKDLMLNMQMTHSSMSEYASCEGNHNENIPGISLQCHLDLIKDMDQTTNFSRSPSANTSDWCPFRLRTSILTASAGYQKCNGIMLQSPCAQSVLYDTPLHHVT